MRARCDPTIKVAQVLWAFAGNLYQLVLRFSDGTHGTVDLTKDLVGELEPLRDPALFRTARVSRGVVVWGFAWSIDGDETYRIDTEFLYGLANENRRAG